MSVTFDKLSSDAEPRLRSAWILGSIGTLEAVYAVVRYHVVKGVPWADLPLYTANKVLAWWALTAIGLALVVGPIARRRGVKPNRDLARDAGRTGAILAAIHTVVSFGLLSPAYFEAWFRPDGRFTANAGISLLAGGIAIVALLATAKGPDKRGIRTLAVGITAIHVFAMGVAGWFAAKSYVAGLVPISLISFLMAIGVLVVRRVLRRQ